MKTTPFPKGVSAPAKRALATLNITEFRQCTEYSERELAQLHGMGPKALNLIREALAELGLSYRQDT